MTEDELTIARHLVDFNYQFGSKDLKFVRHLKRTLLNMSPPSIPTLKAYMLWHVLLRHRVQFRHPDRRKLLLKARQLQFPMNRQSDHRVVERLKKIKGKTLCEIFREEEKRDPKSALRIEKLFNQLLKVKEERRELGLPDIADIDRLIEL